MNTEELQHSKMPPTAGQKMTFEQWRGMRRQQTDDMLSLVGVHEVKVQAEKLGDLPGTWREGPNGVTLTATAKDNITINGESVTSEISLDPGVEISLSPNRTARVGREVYGVWFVKVWDKNAPSLKTFDHIETYPYNLDWEIAAELKLGDPTRSFQVARMTDAALSDPRYAPADVHFNWKGENYNLVCLATFVDTMLMVSFTDATSGSETPFSGRMLILPNGPDGHVVLDFNQAMLPPHEFSDAVPCPSTLRQNRLPFAVTAGEKAIRRS